jgi:hypothetical protein
MMSTGTMWKQARPVDSEEPSLEMSFEPVDRFAHHLVHARTRTPDRMDTAGLQRRMRIRRATRSGEALR